VDRDKAEVLKQMYWEGVCEELDKKIDMALQKLRHTSPEELRVLQERIRTLEEVKGLPDQVIEAKDPNER
jgi:hypothetical protein